MLQTAPNFIFDSNFNNFSGANKNDENLAVKWLKNYGDIFCNVNFFEEDGQNSEPLTKNGKILENSKEIRTIFCKGIEDGKTVEEAAKAVEDLAMQFLAQLSEDQQVKKALEQIVEKHGQNIVEEIGQIWPDYKESQQKVQKIAKSFKFLLQRFFDSFSGGIFFWVKFVLTLQLGLGKRGKGIRKKLLEIRLELSYPPYTERYKNVGMQMGQRRNKRMDQGRQHDGTLNGGVPTNDDDDDAQMPETARQHGTFDIEQQQQNAVAGHTFEIETSIRCAFIATIMAIGFGALIYPSLHVFYGDAQRVYCVFFGIVLLFITLSLGMFIFIDRCINYIVFRVRHLLGNRTPSST
ncbi:hypothetical protein niasHT_012148 [Heterodera trifolii]|uniref:Uncharacterized protein n=1 Tax=Heterodera trifolii TaxID=157864 RepID=A0ABD2LCP7_9BILA